MGAGSFAGMRALTGQVCIITELSSRDVYAECKGFSGFNRIYNSDKAWTEPQLFSGGNEAGVEWMSSLKEECPGGDNGLGAM